MAVLRPVQPFLDDDGLVSGQVVADAMQVETFGGLLDEVIGKATRFERRGSTRASHKEHGQDWAERTVGSRSSTWPPPRSAMRTLTRRM